MLSNKVREIMTPQVTSVEASESIFDVMETMAAKDLEGVIITDHQRPVGIFTGWDVLKRVTAKRLDSKNTNIKRVMTAALHSIGKETPIIEALGKMQKKKCRHLLVRGSRRAIVGMISLPRILAMAAECEEYLTEPQAIGSLMSADVVTVDASQSIHEAIEAMVRKKTGCIIVLVHGRPGGIFTERDVVKRVAVTGIDTRRTPVREVMTEELVTMPESALAGQVLAEMCKRGFRNMPIRGEKGELVGVVSVADILKYAKCLDVDRIVRMAWREIEEFWNSEMQYTPG